MFYTYNPKARLTVWFARKLLRSAFKLEFESLFLSKSYKQIFQKIKEKLRNIRDKP